MESKFLKVTVVLASLGWCAHAAPVTPESPVTHFGDIQQRNLFGLKSAEPKIDTPVPPKLPRLILTGITTILGNKRALLKQLPPPESKAPAQGQELLLMLTEGQREGAVEVLQIDERAGAVKVSNSGTVMTLTFEKDGPKPPVSAPPNQGILPGALSNSAMATAPANGFHLPGYSISNAPPLPTRLPRVGLPGAVSANPSSPGLSPTGPATMPPMVYPNPTAATAESQAIAEAQRQVLQQAASTPNLTAEDRQALLEAQRQIMQHPAANLPGGGSGTFTTPTPAGIAPAFTPPQNRPIVPQ